MTDIPAAVREGVQARSGGHCERCGRVLTSGGHLHHRLPRSGGGGHTPANLVHICGTCHNWAHAHPVDAELTGWVTLRSGTVGPLWMQAGLFGRGWYLLDDSFGFAGWPGSVATQHLKDLPAR